MGYQRWAAAPLGLALVLAWTLAPAQTTGDKPSPQSYGPVLYLNGKPVADQGRRDPAEVHDEADTGANPAAAAAQPRSRQPDQQGQQARQAQQQQQQQQQQRRQQAARRHPAWQTGNEPMAPRPLREGEARAAQGLTIPPPAAAPQPVVPSSSVINGCQGNFCTDASGKSYNGGGNAGVDSGGRLCTRTGTTVQCF